MQEHYLIHEFLDFEMFPYCAKAESVRYYDPICSFCGLSRFYPLYFSGLSGING